MGKKIPYEDIPKPTMDMPEGTFLFEIEKLEEGVTSKKGYFCVNASYRCVEPPEMAGRVHFEMYTLGTEGDPNADEPETLKKSLGMQNLKEHLSKAKVKGSNDLDKWFSAAIGHKVVFWFKEKTDNKEYNKDGSRNEYFGQVRTRVQKAFMEGEVPLGEGVSGSTGKKVGAGTPPLKVVPPAKVKAAPPVDDDDDDEVEEKPAKKVAAKKAPAEDYDDEDDD